MKYKSSSRLACHVTELVEAILKFCCRCSTGINKLCFADSVSFRLSLQIPRVTYNIVA